MTTFMRSAAYGDFILPAYWNALSTPQDEAGTVASAMSGVRLIETLVLHEHIYFPVPRSKLHLLAGDPLLTPFVDAGIVTLHPSAELDEALSAAAASGWPRFETVLLGASLAHAVSVGAEIYVPPVTAASSHVLLEEFASQALKNWTRKSEGTPKRDEMVLGYARMIELLALLRDPASTHNSSYFHKSYQRLSKHTGDTLTHLKEAGRPIPVLLPPISTIVLDQARDRDDIGRAALAIRSELADARKLFRKYEAAIVSDQLPIAESADALRSLQKSLDALVADGSRRELIGLASWREAFEVARATVEGSVAGGVLGLAGALLGAPLKAIHHRQQRHQILYLAQIKDRFMSIGSYSDLLHKKLGVTLTTTGWHKGIQELERRSRGQPPKDSSVNSRRRRARAKKRRGRPDPGGQNH